MGPDSNKMFKPGIKSQCMLALWFMEIKDRNRLKSKRQEDKDHSNSQQIKLNNFTVSLWVKIRENLNPIIESQLPLRLNNKYYLQICMDH